MEIVVEVAVLCLVPVIGGWLVVAGFVGFTAGGGPVLILRVVEAEFDALLFAFSCQFLERVALEGSCGDDVEGVGLGVEHGKAVVVLGGDDNVFHACADLARATMSCALKPVGLKSLANAL